MPADYILTADPNVVKRTADFMFIPNDEANSDWQTYQQWLADGGVPDPYVPPEPVPPQPTNEQQTVALYDHEQRLRVIEGQPPLTMDAFMAQLRSR